MCSFFFFFSCVVQGSAKTRFLETSVENTRQTKALFWIVVWNYLNACLGCVYLVYRTFN